MISCPLVAITIGPLLKHIRFIKHLDVEINFFSSTVTGNNVNSTLLVHYRLKWAMTFLYKMLSLVKIFLGITEIQTMKINPEIAIKFDNVSLEKYYNKINAQL